MLTASVSSPAPDVIGRPKAEAAREALVSASGISVSFKGKPTLVRVSIAVHQGEIVTLIGPNGAGKTTLARALLGLVAVSQGQVARRPGLRVGYVPQRFPIEPIVPLSVLRFMGLSQPVPKLRALECLAETGAEHL